MLRMKKKKTRWTFLVFLLLCIVYGTFAWCIQTQAQDEDVITLKEDSTTDDIQSALSLNAANSSRHLTVKVPAGTYILDKALFIYSNTTLELDENTTFILKSEKYKVMISSYNYKYDKGGYDQVKNVEVIGGNWDGNGTSGEMMRFIHGTNITVKNANIYNVGNGSHLITFAGVKNGVIQNCTLSGYHGTAVKEAIHLDIVHNNQWVPGTVTYDDTANDTILIQNNTVFDYPRAVGSHSSVKGVYHKNVVIQNNTFKDLTNEAVNLYGYKMSSVLNNTIDNVGIGVRIYTLLANGKQYEPLTGTKTEEIPTDYEIQVKDNKITNTKQYGIQLYGAKSQPMTGVTIIGNTIQNTSDTALMIYSYSTKNIIKNNKIQKVTNHGIGIYQNSNSNKVVQNTIQTTTKQGVYVGKSKYTLIKSNKISNAKKHGIWLDSGSNKTKVINNTILNPKEIGIGLKKANGSTILNNKIIGAKKFGLYAVESKQITVQGNTYSKIEGKTEKIS